MTTTPQQRRELVTLDRAALEQHQVRRFNALLDQILPANRFYVEKLAQVKRPLTALDELADWPFTFKDELLDPHRPGDWSNNMTFPLERYTRFHQTSGTRGRPLVVLDTADDWRWFCNCWQYVLDAAEITPADRAMMAFSFGPYIAFWSAYAALADRGCLIATGGGLTTMGRLELMRASRATALFCTPSYALHMAEVAEQHQMDVADWGVRRLVLAGEPGGSIPGVRMRLEATWNAQVLDHSGATEVGPWGFGDSTGKNVYLLEAEFIPEFLSIDTGEPAKAGELAELVLTNLGRVGCPVIRYRTGDLVRPRWLEGGPTNFVLLEGGVLGRVDDMLIVRGVNIFPSSIEHILRSFPEVVEFRLTATRVAELDQLSIEIEDRLGQPQRVADELRLRLGLRIDVTAVPLGTLPRYETKGQRFVDHR